MGNRYLRLDRRPRRCTVIRRVFIGRDPRQPLAYTVAAQSLLEHSSVPLAITPLVLKQLPIQRRGLTEFTFTRYLVPYLCGFEGPALFIDADVLVRGDVATLPWDHPHDVAVVPHDHVLVDGQRISVRFERASVMLFNCSACRVLTPEFIEKDEPQSFAWAKSVGELPREWNHLVGYDRPGPASLVHFTQGIPCFPQTQGDEYAAEWRAARDRALATCSWEDIMGGSVHRRFKEPAAPGVAQLLNLQGARRG